MKYVFGVFRSFVAFASRLQSTPMTSRSWTNELTYMCQHTTYDSATVKQMNWSTYEINEWICTNIRQCKSLALDWHSHWCVFDYLPQHCWVKTLDKFLTPVASVTKQYNLVPGWVNRVQHFYSIHFGEESFQAIDCTATDNQTVTTKNTNYTHKKLIQSGCS